MEMISLEIIVEVYLKDDGSLSQVVVVEVQ